MKLRNRRQCVSSVFQRSLALICLVLVVGCSKSPHDSTVSGTVSLDGVPIGPGIIQFVPVGRGHNPATGTIQVDGEYQLKTNNAEGLQPGDYDVTVAVYDHPEVKAGERAAPGSAPLRTPEKYLSLSTTDLQFTVENGKNNIDVLLVSQGDSESP